MEKSGVSHIGSDNFKKDASYALDQYRIVMRNRNRRLEWHHLRAPTDTARNRVQVACLATSASAEFLVCFYCGIELKFSPTHTGWMRFGVWGVVWSVRRDHATRGAWWPCGRSKRVWPRGRVLMASAPHCRTSRRTDGRTPPRRRN